MQLQDVLTMVVAEHSSHTYINDKVRISITKAGFERAYNYQWTGEIFIVAKRFYKQSIAKYKCKEGQ